MIGKGFVCGENVGTAVHFSPVLEKAEAGPISDPASETGVSSYPITSVSTTLSNCFPICAANVVDAALTLPSWLPLLKL